ncbi:MAG: amidohydrolase family protein, partial [Candidatus Gracilibacteria bacterium]|nr:amidohydrolase family protein [Candidatus Gracilibacteria bacterium]
MSKTLLKNSWIIDGINNPFFGSIEIDDKIIGNIYKEGEKIDESIYDEIIDIKKNIVCPGLINTHNHAGMFFFRGFASGLPLQEWLQEVWKIEDKLTSEDIYWGTMSSILEM